MLSQKDLNEIVKIPPNNRNDEQVLQLRTEAHKDIIEMMMNLKSTPDICNVITKKYGYSVSTVKNHMCDCRKFIRNNYTIDEKKEMLIKHVDILQRLIAENMENAKGNPKCQKNVIDAIKTIHMIVFDKTDKPQLQQNVINLTGLSMEQMEKMLEKIEEKDDKNNTEDAEVEEL